jgi:16S rRNA (guanine527-N7)-methyltransferase
MVEQEVENERQSAALRIKLVEGCNELGLSLETSAIDKLIEYVGLLHRWNRAYNLTAIREPERMISHHLLDSLSVATYVRGPRVLDMGTGPGLPGIPLAITMPDTSFVLLDSNGKKTRFLVQVKSALGLENVEVVQSRVEDYRPGTKFDTITARAFATLATMLRHSAHLCAESGQYLMMKGKLPDEELPGIPVDFTARDAIALKVPGVEGERHLIIVTPS